MKSSNLFWGFFFITFGSLYLVAKYTSLMIDWYAIWELWPVLIILAGLAIILKGTFVKPILSVLIGVLLAFLAFGFVNDVFEVFDDGDFRRSEWNHFSERNDYSIEFNNNIEHVNLNMKAGAGKFNIGKVTDKLVKGYSRGNIGDYDFTQTQEDSIAWVDLSMEKVDIDLFGSSLENQFNLSLNKKPTYSFDFEIGAAKAYFNLIPFKVKNLVLTAGATETKIKFGDQSEMLYVNVEMGAAALQIYIPQESGCKITGDMVLMAKELDDFKSEGSNYYITDNYEDSSNKIVMEVKGGISSLEIKRY